MFRTVALTVVFLAAAVEVSPARIPQPFESPSPEPTLSPRDLFHRTFARLKTYPIPPYVLVASLWQVQPITNVHNHEFDVVWRYAIRDGDGSENASILNVAGYLPKANVGKKSIGVFATILKPPRPDAEPSSAEESDLKTIAVVEATLVDYRMHLVGTEVIESHVTDHIRLEPVRNPQKYNLRDLWIDAQTFDLRRATFVFWGDDSLRNGASITADFGPAQQYWIVVRSSWCTVRYDFKLTTIRVVTPSTLPDWLFDQPSYDQHQRAHELDPLYEILNPTPLPSPTPSGSPRRAKRPRRRAREAASH